MYDQNLSHLKLLMVVMVMKMVMVMKTQPNIRSLPSRNVPKKQYFFYGAEEEELMCEFLHANPMIWDIKKSDYRRLDKKAKLWEDQANAMGRTMEHLQGWFKSLRDAHTRLHKKKSGDGAPVLTDREQWVKSNFEFHRNVIRHRPEPANSVSKPFTTNSLPENKTT